MTQQIAAPRYRRTALIVVALLLVALAVGAVTAVNLFPARADQQAADESTRMNEFRAGERASLTQAASQTTSLNEFRAGERASLTQVTGRVPGRRAPQPDAGERPSLTQESTSINEFRAGERASLTQVDAPLGR